MINERNHTRDIVYISCIAWTYSWHRQQEMMSEMVKRGYRVLFVEPSSHNMKEHLLKEVQKNVWTITPAGMPYERCSHIINRINSTLSRKSIVRAMEKLHFKNPIIWFDRVHGVDSRWALERFYSVYDLVDELLAFGRIKNKKMLISLENYVLQHANLLVSSSMTLLNRKNKQIGRECQGLFIPNGADEKRFLNSNRWKGAEEITKPILGFVGTISERSINFELINTIAFKHPEWQFVFVGPGTAKNHFKGDNIHVFDAVPGEEIPTVINTFDVGLIPYNIEGELMDYVFPRKACEYLFSGKPVVSTALAEVDILSPYVKKTRSVEEFEKGIIEALEESNKEQARIHFAAQYDWQVLMNKLEDRLSESAE